MDNGVLNKPKKKNWGLTIALIILVLAIIGLVVGIIINHFNNKPGDGQTGENEKDIVTEIVDYINKVDITEAEEYLNEKVEEYKGTEKELDVRMTKARYLRDIGQYAEALETMDDLMERNLSSEDTIMILHDIYETYDKMGDVERAEEYNKKYWEEYLRYYNGGAGGA